MLTPERSPLLPKLLFVASAAGAALALRLSWEEPVLGIALLVAIVVGVGARYLSRRRTLRLLQSGDVEGIISRWSSSLRNVPHAKTMAPLMTATAFAAYGWVDRARAALDEAERGPAWDAALEHRLFVDTLLLTFEGDHHEAMATATTLERLPMPAAGPHIVERVRVLRAAVGALARAFSHNGRDGDRRVLIAASDTSPLVHWAMRYGAAILSIDAGEVRLASALLHGAPTWPAESRFNEFHDEIAREVTRRTEAAHPDGAPAGGSPVDREATDSGAAGTVVDEEDSV
jgi:hypothetical protein